MEPNYAWHDEHDDDDAEHGDKVVVQRPWASIIKGNKKLWAAKCTDFENYFWGGPNLHFSENTDFEDCTSVWYSVN